MLSENHSAQSQTLALGLIQWESFTIVNLDKPGFGNRLFLIFVPTSKLVVRVSQLWYRASGIDYHVWSMASSTN